MVLLTLVQKEQFPRAPRPLPIWDGKNQEKKRVEKKRKEGKAAPTAPYAILKIKVGILINA